MTKQTIATAKGLIITRMPNTTGGGKYYMTKTATERTFGRQRRYNTLVAATELPSILCTAGARLNHNYITDHFRNMLASHVEHCTPGSNCDKWFTAE